MIEIILKKELMKLLRYITFPIVPIYFLVTWLRNKLYDKGIKKSKSYNFPVICVGNLSAGGTGKTPMVEYLIKLLKNDHRLASLSRGYGRKTGGFQLGSDISTAETLGDEPYQFYNKFSKDIDVAVDIDRQNGIAKLRNLSSTPDVIILDDAFQHRKVKAGFNIVLTTYSNLYFKDWVLPTGNLREPRRGAKRAQIIVVTKCPEDLKETERQSIIKGIDPENDQQVFFSSISYAKEVLAETHSIQLNELPKFTLVTGIANAKPLVSHLKEQGLNFNHLEYKDHYGFTESDAKELEEYDLIITTEKDYMRLKVYKNLMDKLYYLPIEIAIDNAEVFDKTIRGFVTS